MRTRCVVGIVNAVRGESRRACSASRGGEGVPALRVDARAGARGALRRADRDAVLRAGRTAGHRCCLGPREGEGSWPTTACAGVEACRASSTEPTNPTNQLVHAMPLEAAGVGGTPLPAPIGKQMGSAAGSVPAEPSPAGRKQGARAPEPLGGRAPVGPRVARTRRSLPRVKGASRMRTWARPAR